MDYNTMWKKKKKRKIHIYNSDKKHLTRNHPWWLLRSSVLWFSPYFWSQPPLPADPFPKSSLKAMQWLGHCWEQQCLAWRPLGGHSLPALNPPPADHPSLPSASGCPGQCRWSTPVKVFELLGGDSAGSRCSWLFNLLSGAGPHYVHGFPLE